MVAQGLRAFWGEESQLGVGGDRSELGWTVESSGANREKRGCIYS